MVPVRLIGCIFLGKYLYIILIGKVVEGRLLVPAGVFGVCPERQIIKDGGVVDVVLFKVLLGI